jgi:adenylate cyclase
MAPTASFRLALPYTSPFVLCPMTSEDAHARNPKIAAILVACIFGYKQARRDEDASWAAQDLARRSDRSDYRVDHGRVVKRTGDGSIIEFKSVVGAVRCR